MKYLGLANSSRPMRKEWFKIRRERWGIPQPMTWIDRDEPLCVLNLNRMHLGYPLNPERTGWKFSSQDCRGLIGHSSSEDTFQRPKSVLPGARKIADPANNAGHGYPGKKFDGLHIFTNHFFTD